MIRRLIAVVLGAVLCTSAAARGVPASGELAPYLRPQRLIDVGGHALNVYCTGRGSPAVILDAGEGESMVTWRKVQPAVAMFTRVCSFDRAGMGFSAPGPLPRDADAMVTDLHALLRRASIPPPYVLVAHSIAGLYAVLYADRYLRELAGMVLVDPSFAYQTEALHAASPTMKKMEAGAAAAYTACFNAAVRRELRLDRGSPAFAPCGFPAHADVELRAQCAKKGPAWCALQHLTYARLARPSFWSALRSEDDASTAVDSAEISKEQRRYGALPLTVLTAAEDTGESPLPRGETLAVEGVWNAGHDRVARTSSAGVNRLVRDSGHFIQLDQPTAVVTAVASIVHARKALRR